LIVQQQVPVRTLVSGFGDVSRQQPCFSAVVVACFGLFAAAFIGHPAGIPEPDVKHAATRSAGRRKPVNIRNAVKSSGSVRRDIVCSGYVITKAIDSKKTSLL
jgi:hypothetical protein